MDEENVIGTLDVDDGTVEVRTQYEPVTVGEELEFDIVFSGRRRQWSGNEVTLTLETPYRTRTGCERASLGHVTLLDEPEIESSLIETRSPTITLPAKTPGTVGNVNVLGTVEITTDDQTTVQDNYFDVTSPVLESVFTSMVDLGFTPRDIDCVADSSHGGLQFAHRFVFQPVDGAFQSEFDSVQLFCQSVGDEVTVFTRIDRENELPVDLAEVDGPRTVIREVDSDAVSDQLETFFRRNIHSE